MNKIITYSFCESFIENLMSFIDQNYLQDGKDIRRLAIVFPGKRPSLFLKRELARRLKKSFYPPRFFTIDEFMGYTVAKGELFNSARDLDQCYLLYNLVKQVSPEILENRASFAAFLPWAREILSFIDQLDLENVANDTLTSIEANAQIGYAVPEDINHLLGIIVRIREAYHEYMLKEKTYARGFQYKRAAEVIERIAFDEFEQIFFCNFFYFNRTEEAVVKSLYERDKAFLFFQGDERRWPVFRRISENFSFPIQEGETPQTPQFDLKLYSGFDVHSQMGTVREILKTIKNYHKTVIVLPEPDHIIPLLSEMTSVVKEFNISMGYPLKRSSLYSLFGFIFKAQLSKEEDGYYTRDYLKCLRHPLVKNLRIADNATVTRVLIHKIEEILTGQERTSISGSIFIDPQDVLHLDDLYELTAETLKGLGITTTRRELRKVMTEITALVFHNWEGIGNFHEFAKVLEDFLDVFIQKSSLSRYPLNLKIVSRILDLTQELKTGDFSREDFTCEDIFKIFDAKMEREMVAFVGSPLKGLQVLGLFETRSLNFENVIVLDVNEGVLPRLNIYDPLIPREVMISLNLDRLEKEEEIQRYQFMRLIASAKTVHLVYQEGRDKEKSRFVEELIWEEQKKRNSPTPVDIIRPSFEVKITSPRIEIQKTPEMITFLKGYKYSASSINTYLRSPLDFYFNYVLGLQEREDLLNEPENRQVGTFVHEVLEEAFKTFAGKKPVIDIKFRNYFQKILDRRFAATLGKNRRADAFLLKSVLDARLNRFLDNEAENPERKVAQVLFVEKRFDDQIPLSCGSINFVYKLDRVDKMEDGSIMIIDYKTGSMDPMPKGIEQIESLELSREAIADTVKSFQIPLYFYYLDKYFKEQSVNAAFYNLRTCEVKKFIDGKRDYDNERINKAFLRALDYILCEILNPQVSFSEDGGVKCRI